MIKFNYVLCGWKNINLIFALFFKQKLGKNEVFCRAIEPLFAIVVLFGLISCRTNCSDFDKKNLTWIPYQESDVIELYSQLNDSIITFPINRVEVSHTTHYSFGSKCGGCSDEIFVNDYNSDFYVEIYLHENKIGSQNYKIIDTYFSNYSEAKNYLFESKEYDLVRIFEINDSQGTFRKLIVAKDIGVIGLIDINGNTWTLKTNVKIKRLNNNGQQKSVVINNVSC